nr:MAG TPA: hypothetical protein [Caudoviricetes sp.]
MKNKEITKAEVEKAMNYPGKEEIDKMINEFLKQTKEQLKEKLKMKRKIKLRDLTKEQWDNYKEKNCMWHCENCIFGPTKCYTSGNKKSWINHKDIYSDKFLDMEIEIEEPDILDEVEKRYLRAVIKPFRDRVISISKYFYAFDNAYAINIYVMSLVGIFEKEIIRLPLFRNEMYKGMAKNKVYTLEDLDL